MHSQTIRRKFLDYFRQHRHTVVPSSAVVPHDDPTLLFINAGMNQFKDVFLGKSLRDYSRATTSQKCIRVGGKHNDLENVGHTARHLTFFEMLGNFSFGSYFKEDSIKFAWEVSTSIFELDPERIWPTIFTDDDEAFEIWKQYVPESRICRFGEKQNFWSMGDTGPCGPCSELLYDRGPKYGDASTPLEDVTEERYLEFWNLVFMQYNRNEQGLLEPLPKPSIDTGAGLERVVSLSMDVESVYDTDILRGLITSIEEISEVTYRIDDAKSAPAFRVIADHLRTLAFAIADGVQPSNVDRGYVLRKVLRRAVRYGRTLGLNKPFLGQLLPKLYMLMGEDYPELERSHSRAEEILFTEEEAFIKTLRRGGNILNEIITHAQKEKRKISGEEAFKLKDTYGLPIEEILLIARDADLSVDTKKYETLEEEAKERSRKVHKGTKQLAEENLFADYIDTHAPCEFIGYTEHAAKGKITALVVNGQFVEEIHPGTEAIVLIDRTPFYAEKGGQVGDQGVLRNGEVEFNVQDCQSPFTGVIAHIGALKTGTLRLGENITAVINEERRQGIANHHTATHLLNWALCKILGDQVKQAGSVVEAGRLRFDFSHHKALSQEEIRTIEDLVNHKIRENIPVKAYELTYEEASKHEEIKQFFGDKYGNIVRVIDINYSKELCGGTHTSATGNIGTFRIAKEGSIAAGVRRIEAVTGETAESLNRSDEDLLHEISALLKTSPQKLLSRIEKLLADHKTMELEVKTLKQQQRKHIILDVLAKKEEINTFPFIAATVPFGPKELRQCADEIMEKLHSGVLVLSCVEGDHCQLTIRMTEDLIAKGLSAQALVQTVAPIIDGKGGGKANQAQVGGKAPHNLAAAINAAKEMLRQS